MKETQKAQIAAVNFSTTQGCMGPLKKNGLCNIEPMDIYGTFEILQYL